MRHADHDFPCARASRLANHFVEHRDQRVGAFHREALVALIRPTDEALEPVHLIEATQRLLLFVGREITRKHTIAERALKPVALFIHFEMPHFPADATRVDLAFARDRVGGGREACVAQRLAGNRLQVGLGQPPVRRAQILGARRRRTKRIELHGVVAVAADGLLQRGGRGHFPEERDVVGRATGRSGRWRSRRAGRTLPEQRLGDAEVLAPRLVHTGGVVTITLELFGKNAVVENARDGSGHNLRM